MNIKLMQAQMLEPERELSSTNLLAQTGVSQACTSSKFLCPGHEPIFMPKLEFLTIWDLYIIKNYFLGDHGHMYWPQLVFHIS
jgi:hypothetical protein